MVRYKLISTFLLILLFPIKSWTMNSAINNDNPLKLLFQNKSHIIELMNNLLHNGTLDENKKYTYTPEYMSKIIDSSYNVWLKNDTSILKEFLYIIAPKTSEYNIFQYYISDSVTISIIVSYLDYFSYDVHKGYTIPRDSIWMVEEPLTKPGEIYGKKEDDWVRDALELLIYSTHFPALKKHSQEIAQHLKKCNAPLMFKLQLLTLCDSNTISNEKKSQYLELINEREDKIKTKHAKLSINDSVYKKEFYYEPVPIWVKALLGDSISLKKIKDLAKRKDEYSLMSFIDYANYIWTPEIQKIFLSLYSIDVPLCNTSKEDRYIIIEMPVSNYKTCRSLQDSLTMALARHHVNEPIFGNFYSANRRSPDFCKPDGQQQYFIKLAEWIKTNYNYEIKYDKFKPYFVRDVSREQNAIHDLCK
jgi:hypothetical protein